MDQLPPDQLLQQASQLSTQNKFADIITLLADTLLDENKNADLYNWKAYAYSKLNQPDTAINYYTKAIDADNTNVYAYFQRGLLWQNKQEYDKSFDDYTKAISLDPKHAYALNNRGLIKYSRQQYDDAINDYTSAITIDPNFADAYNNRGNVWYYKKNYDNALKDYLSALDKDPRYVYAHNNCGLIYNINQQYDKAIESYSRAIALDDKYAMAYYNRAVASNAAGKFVDAINDYQQYITLTANPDDYWAKVAQAKIEDLKKKEDKSYDTVSQIVASIKALLFFNDDCIVHYTGLSAAKAMLLSPTGSVFRLSEGAFLNDTSEGRELYDYLEFSSMVSQEQSTLAKAYTEKPFIGSFLSKDKYDDLTLWRMYGKEGNEEAKGCSLTIDKNTFLTNLKQKMTGAVSFSSDTDGTTAIANMQSNTSAEGQFTFYQVAYITRDAVPKFIIPGNPQNQDGLTTLASELKDTLKYVIDDKQKHAVKELVNEIAYLFKSADYFYENEVRLVVDGTGFDKIIDTSGIMPKVYIELINLAPVLNKITLGPKVERAEEWAAAFNYKLKNDNKGTTPVEIVMSHLPFK